LGGTLMTHWTDQYPGETAIVHVAGFELRTFIDDDDPGLARVIIRTRHMERDDSVVLAWDGEQLERGYDFARAEAVNLGADEAMDRARGRVERGQEGMAECGGRRRGRKAGSGSRQQARSAS